MQSVASRGEWGVDASQTGCLDSNQTARMLSVTVYWWAACRQSTDTGDIIATPWLCFPSVVLSLNHCHRNQTLVLPSGWRMSEGVWTSGPVNPYHWDINMFISQWSLPTVLKSVEVVVVVAETREDLASYYTPLLIYLLPFFFTFFNGMLCMHLLYYCLSFIRLHNDVWQCSCHYREDFWSTTPRCILEQRRVCMPR